MRRIAVDGAWGVDWEDVLKAILDEVERRGLSSAVFRTDSAVHDSATLLSVFQESLGENPTFGRVSHAPISSYFDGARWEELLAAYAGEASDVEVAVLIGPGACCGNPVDAEVRVYCDTSRERVITRQNTGALGNFGFGGSVPGHSPYKVAYYVEWPIFEAHKRAVWPYVDLYASQDDGGWRWTSRNSLDLLIADVSRRPFRCKPFFMPGVWGGRRLQEVAAIGADWPNCAWDFEMIAPENAVTLGHRGERITIPVHLLLWQSAESVMGSLVFQQFGDYFPIRLNYLDTIGGSNLSCQVHPHASYMRERFGEPVQQDESYYVVESRPGASVYLGFREGVTRDEFRAVVARAEEEQEPFDLDAFVAAWPSEVGALYLIPAGTVHASGKENLVLEISSTPYWYTFKLYDYLRPDLSGKPRPINAKYGFDVLDFSRTEAWVDEALIPEPQLVRAEEGGREYLLGTSPFVYYAVARLHVDSVLSDDTEGRFHMIAVVAGAGVRLTSETDPDAKVSVGYLEVFVVPAAFGAYRVEAVDGPAQVIKAYVKW